MTPSEGKSPFLKGNGDHIVKIVNTERVAVQAKDPWLKIEIEIVESTSDDLKEGTKRTIRKVLTEKAFAMSGPEIMTMTMAMFGFTNEQVEDFQNALVESTGSFCEDNGWEPDDLVALFLDCVEKNPDAIAVCDESGSPVFGPNPLEDMMAKLSTSQATPEDYTNFDWGPLPHAD